MEEKNKRTVGRENKQSVIEKNNSGPRLLWIRGKLNLGVIDVQNGSGLAPSTLSDWEQGIRSGYWEAILSLSMFYAPIWKERFDGFWPHYRGEQVKEITTQFIMFGEDKTMSELLKLTHDYEEQKALSERREALSSEELKMANSQLDLLKGLADA
tara:strand:+ start:13318 stop:13782 length:465 start_codon:yes stop_codon:yes gene_type:complete